MTEPIKFSYSGQKADAANVLPSLLQPRLRGGSGGADVYLLERAVRVKAVYTLAPAGRGTPAARQDDVMAPEDVVVLEAPDGATLFMRADRLLEEAKARLPEAIDANGQLLLDALRPRDAGGRGPEDWAWSKVSVLELLPDDIVEAARRKALEWLGDKAKGTLQDWAGLAVTRLGTKALMWAIESRLPQGPGLYRWAEGGEDGLQATTPRMLATAAEKPVLLFIHGTASSSAGSFADLGRGNAVWGELKSRFGEHIYAFEHRSFSESPVDNALELAEALPAGARLSLVTHSRGGLVGDLLCMGWFDDALIESWERPERPDSDLADRTALVEEEKGKLRRLRDLLQQRGFRVERYVRVASPARGTRLAGGNFDVFLSGLLNLIGLVPVLAASPVYSAVKRIVLEIARNRCDPVWVPGIEAMLPDSPLGTLLARAPRQMGAQMAVIAGDIEGEGFFKRLAVMFTDWMFFDNVDNDLVVDTESMFAGLARQPGARYQFVKGPRVSHFRYFENDTSRQSLKEWLTASNVESISAFAPIESRWQRSEEESRTRRERRAAMPRPPRPVVFVLPGVMGTHLALDGKRSSLRKRIWLDPTELMGGGLAELAWTRPPGEATVTPDGLFEMFYGDCCEMLEDSHEVVRFPYDWRLSIAVEADRLATAIEAKLAATEQPIRLLAHSMGGLVARAMIARYPDLWNSIVARPGGRLVMLGTPNNGSHSMVETLIGKADSVRWLARADRPHKLQEILDIVAGFRGALQLLPRPTNFIDIGETAAKDYFKPDMWINLKEDVRDFWFGDRVAAVPAAKALTEARELWEKVLPDNAAPMPADRVAYVFGVARRTACGVQKTNGKLQIQGTPLGDGTVTWASGRLDGLENRCWYMPASHGDLLNSPDHFGAIAELLNTGTTRQLDMTPPAVRAPGEPQVFTYDAAPPVIPSPDELATAIMNGRPRLARRRGDLSTLHVEICAQDLRFARSTVLCGHYIADPTTGAEAWLDRHVVDGALSQRSRLGQYAGRVGTYALALAVPADDIEPPRPLRQRGALVVGLGEYGSLTAAAVTETVCAGALHLLLHYHSQVGKQASGERGVELELSPLLVGYNSTSNLRIEDSIEAVVMGVAQANRQFAMNVGTGLRIGRLRFTELYLDTALSAVHALRTIRPRLEAALAEQDTALAIEETLIMGTGYRQRLQTASVDGYWARLQIVDADAEEDDCAPECHEVRLVSSIPKERCRELLADELATTQARRPCPPLAAPRLAERLKFLFLSSRARAEQVFQQRQPGLIESLVAGAIDNSQFNRDHCRSLYELMVPLDFRGIVAGADRLMLVVDGYTANLPWEMLVVGDRPLVVRTSLVRQLATSRYRNGIRVTLERNAYVIGNPATNGFHAHFPDPEGRPIKSPDQLKSLVGAEKEAKAVESLLRQHGYTVEAVISDGDSDKPVKALDVIGGLFRRPYRIVHIAAHGVFSARDRECRPRTGVVLSDGLLLTAAEIGQLEIVPDLVFLNCCHLGVADNLPRNGNRIAYSLARELIEMGVRCVIVAGWSVWDDAAQLFAETFYDAMVGDNAAFGDAVQQARIAVWQRMPNCNTWGAYQAYGDPMFRFDTATKDDAKSDNWRFAAPVELVNRIAEMVTVARASATSTSRTEKDRWVNRVQGWLANSPGEWRDRPDVRFALGGFYAELGSDYFPAAIDAFGQAATGGDDQLSAPIKAIEQLANIEVRHGIATGNETLIKQGLNRIVDLLKLVPGTPNAERWSLLGSARKRYALFLADKHKPWKTVAKFLAQAREAYAMAEGGKDGQALAPYPAINRLQLEGLLADSKQKALRDADIELANTAVAEAKRRFAQRGDFFDAVAPADALLARHLIANDWSADTADELTRAYEEAMRHVPRSDRQIDSVMRQLEILIKLLRLRGKEDKAGRANKTNQAVEAMDAVCRRLAAM